MLQIVLVFSHFISKAFSPTPRNQLSAHFLDTLRDPLYLFIYLVIYLFIYFFISLSFFINLSLIYNPFISSPLSSSDFLFIYLISHIIIHLHLPIFCSLHLSLSISSSTYIFISSPIFSLASAYLLHLLCLIFMSLIHATSMFISSSLSVSSVYLYLLFIHLSLHLLDISISLSLNLIFHPFISSSTFRFISHLYIYLF